MSLNKWIIEKEAYLDKLTLSNNGDRLEKYAISEHSLCARFPNYEIFWRYIVRPATLRGEVVGYRKGVSIELRKIFQLSYSILQNLIQSDRLSRLICNREFGFFYSNIQSCILFSGNALQLLTTLQGALENLLCTITKKKTLIFPNIKDGFLTKRQQLINYRNYLSHSGLILGFPNSNGMLMVPRPDKIISNRKTSTVWNYKIKLDKKDYVRFDTIAVELNDKIWSFTNECYEKFYDALTCYFSSMELQRAWGWDKDD